MFLLHFLFLIFPTLSLAMQQPQCTIVLKDEVTKTYNCSDVTDDTTTILDLLKYSKVIESMLEDTSAESPRIDLSWMPEKDFEQMLVYCKKIHKDPNKTLEIELSKNNNSTHQELISLFNWADRLDIQPVLKAGYLKFEQLLKTIHSKEKDDVACTYEAELASPMKDYLKGCIYLNLLQTNSWLFNTSLTPVATISHSTVINSLAFAPHHPRIAIGGNKTIEIYDYQAQKQVWLLSITIPGSYAPLTNLAFDSHQKSTTLAFLVATSLCWLNAMTSPQEVGTIECTKLPYFNKDLPIAGLALHQKKCQFLDGKYRYTIDLLTEKYCINSIESNTFSEKIIFNNNEPISVITEDKQALIRKRNSETNLFIIQNPQYIDRYAISPNGRYLAFVSGPKVRLYDTLQPVGPRTLADLICMYVKHTPK